MGDIISMNLLCLTSVFATLGIVVSKLASQISGLYFYSDGGVISIDLALFCPFQDRWVGVLSKTHFMFRFL